MKTKQPENIKKDIAQFMRRLYQQGLTSTSGGNISVRISEDAILITPSQTDKGRMRANQIIRLSMDGSFHSRTNKPSMECGFHLAAYQSRSDIQAIVHAHPLAATSLMLAGKTLQTNLTGESRAILGNPVTAPYALMGTPELADFISEAIKNTNVVLMENHGVLTVGKNLLEAFDRMEVLENAARLTLLTEILGGAEPLPLERLLEIDRLISGK
jgi:L-fuculose-phosphate aldolase